MDLTGYPPAKPGQKRRRKVRVAYRTAKGSAYYGTAEHVLSDPWFKRKYKGKVQLIFTSPPFPLNRKKKYGNKLGDEFIDWLVAFAPVFKSYLTKKGSIVMEMGNAWDPGSPTMSTLSLKSLMAFQEKGELHLCQQFIAYNPARLPTPAQWVTIKRVRVKDSYTHVWWMSPTPNPSANNRRVLKPYSKAMLGLLKSGRYNAGRRPSAHLISEESFLTNNKGAIPPNVLMVSNTRSDDPYQKHVREKSLQTHPARMPQAIPEFFINFLTRKNGIVLDPFAGSNTTGAVAQRLGRRWASIEPVAAYLEASRSRFPTRKRKRKRATRRTSLRSGRSRA